MTAKLSFFVIINPVSGNGKGKTIWKKIQDKLNTQFTIDFAFTTHPKHEIELTKIAIKKGITRFVIIGGDGTLNNFINGVFSQNTVDHSDIAFGIIPIGTGNDWVKTHHISKNINKALQTIFDGQTDTQDVGCISYLDNPKSKKYFINLAGIGFDGKVVNIVKNDRALGKLTYILGALKGVFSFNLFDSKITYDKDVLNLIDCFMIQIGVCKYTGSGMQLTKQPNPKDGLFDITIATAFTKWDIIRNLHKLFSGKITSHKKVNVFKTNALKISFNKEQPFIQADGEQLKTGTIEVSIIPNGIRFYC
ncbi:diacylglycerol/lipid kinase family protein [Olleya sp. R77988]|uniref:diacylglycerol/lipid kinase family protein n=1 Tax=Olleya sp. R77988 TaxID=3093875 RepID=UPI0037CC9866